MDPTKLDLRTTPSGTHAALVYDSDVQFSEVVADFVSIGFERREKVVCVAGERETLAIRTQLGERGADPGPLVASGQLEFMQPGEFYLKGGIFQPSATIDDLVAMWERATEEGYAGLRVTGGAVGQGHGDWLYRVLDYECKLNELVADYPMTMLCRYDRRRFDTDVLLAVLRTHPVVIVGTELYDNFYYLPPEVIHAGLTPSTTFDLWVLSLGRYKAIGETLQERESLLRQVVESSNDGIAVVDEAGIVRRWNPAMVDMSGIPISEATGRPLWDLIQRVLPEAKRNPERLESLRTTILEIVQLRPAQWFERLVEHALCRPDGATRWIQASLFPVEARGKTLVGAILRDVTELRQSEETRRKFEEKLRETQKLESLGLLAGGIAHDFNNLLVGILGNAGLALEELSATSPAREAVVDIETAARRAADLARQLLAYSGRGRFLVEPVDLVELVEEMVHLLHASIPKNVIIKLDFVYRPAVIKADIVQIRQVVMNLVTNAAEAIGTRSGVITIATGAMNCDRAYLLKTFGAEDLDPGDYVYLEVSDTGCGMDEATMGRIFDPFFSTKFAGRGLGLAATLGIIRGHNGAIRVYSEPGRGTTFKLLFPASDASLGIKTPARGRDSSVTGTVLVVDDEEWVRAVARRVLERAGFRVITATDGLEGVRTYRENGSDVDLVLLDMTMPHLNGEETFRELRRIQPDVRVILSSGYNEQEAVGRFAGRGLAGFIQKPYSPSELVELIRRVLAGSRRGGEPTG